MTEPTVRVTVTMTDTLKERLSSLAKDEHRDFSAQVTYMLTKSLPPTLTSWSDRAKSELKYCNPSASEQEINEFVTKRMAWLKQFKVGHTGNTISQLRAYNPGLPEDWYYKIMFPWKCGIDEQDAAPLLP